MSGLARIMVIGAGVAMMVAAGALSFALIAGRPAAAPADPAMTPAQARALGARWREEKSAELGVEYARALVSAGLYDELLSEIEQEGLFAGDDDSARVFRAEAFIRQGRFEEAAFDATGGNPYLAYARARAAYGLTSDVAAAERDVAAALRGPKDLAAEAWFFRARAALDENDFDKADAAGRRAADEGAPANRIEAIRIEREIRTGDLRNAAKMIDARAKARRRGKSPAEDLRLSAMIRMRAGDVWGAVSRLDKLRSVEAGAGVPLMSALAKREAGDIAQAWAIANDAVATAPRDWRALDIAQAIAADMNRSEVRNALIARLAREKPTLAALRVIQDVATSEDEKFERLISLSTERYLSAGASLLGEGAPLPNFPEASDREKSLLALAAAAHGKDNERIRANLLAEESDDATPLSLAVAGVAFEALGDRARAKAAFARSYHASPEFFAPQALHARLLAEEGDPEAGAAILRAYILKVPDNKSAFVALGEFELAAGNVVAAAAALTAAGRKMFENDENAALYGRAADAAGGETRAKMLSLARVNAPSARILAEALEAGNDQEGAAAAYRLAAIAEPENPESLARYVAKMNALGRGDEAAELARLLEARRAKSAASDSALP